MNITHWVLVFFLHYPHGGGVDQIVFNNLESCKAAKAQIERMRTHRDSACIERVVK